MSDRKLRVGVVGVGHLGQHHARILARVDGVELVGVADARIEQAKAVAERVGTVAYGDYRDLYDAVDAISIAAPTFLHREIAGNFLARGIATLVEKPLASSAKEAEELVAIAACSGALLQVGHIERFNPALELLDSLSLVPKYITAERMSSYTFRSTDIGVVHDLMIHDIDRLLSLVSSPVKSVSAVGVNVFGGREDIANARIEFEDGCVASLSANRASLLNSREMKIYGDEGFASLDFAAKQGTWIAPSETLKQGVIDLDGVDMTQPAAIKDHVFGKILRVDRVQPEASDALTLELENFVRAAQSTGKPKVDGTAALKAMRLADAILESLNNRVWPVADVSSQPADSGFGRAGRITSEAHELRGPISWRTRRKTSDASISDVTR